MKTRSTARFCLLAIFVLRSMTSSSQVVLPGKTEIVNRKISAVVVSSFSLVDGKSKKGYVDTITFDKAGYLVAKRVTPYDTASERKWAGIWNYTYDSAGNRKLETRKSPHYEVMDYFNYVYDSFHVTKQIWVYWVNLKLAFSRIYEMKYNVHGRLDIEMVEGQTEKLDSIFAWQYDTNNRLIQTTCASDKDFQDTMYRVNYVYNPDGNIAQIITTAKSLQTMEEYTYDENKRLVKQKSGDRDIVYQYDKNGYLASSEVAVEGRKKEKYTYSYIYR